MMLLNKVKEEVAAGRVNEQTHPLYPELSIFKYSEACAFENGWNEVNRICRGLILNTVTGEIVSRSFPKFFNLGEMPETELANLPLDGTYDVYDKVDGSMGSVFWHDGQWHVATPGSMDSEQARMARSMLSQYDTSYLPKDATTIVEIIYPENRIVVDYGPLKALVVLTIFNKDGTEWDRGQVAHIASACRMPIVRKHIIFDWHNIKFAENSEGYVIRFHNGLRVKVKSPIYVMAHRFLTNISISRVIEGIQDGTIAAVAEACPDTWRNKLDDITGLVKNKFREIQSRVIEYDKKRRRLITLQYDPKNVRKRYALWIQENVPKEYQPGAFLMLSDKDITDFVWKLTEEQLKNEYKISVAS